MTNHQLMAVSNCEGRTCLRTLPHSYDVALWKDGMGGQPGQFVLHSEETWDRQMTRKYIAA